MKGCSYLKEYVIIATDPYPKKQLQVKRGMNFVDTFSHGISLAETISRELSGLKAALSLPKGHLCSARDASFLWRDDFWLDTLQKSLTSVK